MLGSARVSTVQLHLTAPCSFTWQHGALTTILFNVISCFFFHMGAAYAVQDLVKDITQHLIPRCYPEKMMGWDIKKPSQRILGIFSHRFFSLMICHRRCICFIPQLGPSEMSRRCFAHIHSSNDTGRVVPANEGEQGVEGWGEHRRLPARIRCFLC